ncbi:hypothetical protein GCM10027028_61760 [Streptomyces sundarbansensis]
MSERLSPGPVAGAGGLPRPPGTGDRTAGEGPIRLPCGYESLVRDRPAPLVRQVGPMTARQLLTPDLPPRYVTPDLPGACVPAATPARPQDAPQSRRRPSSPCPPPRPRE